MAKLHFIKSFFLLISATLLVGCASLSPEKANQRAQAMNDFELCLAVEAEMDRHTFALDPMIVEAAKNQAFQSKLDCALKREEVIKFLVRALRDEELRNLNNRFHFGFGVRGGW